VSSYKNVNKMVLKKRHRAYWFDTTWQVKDGKISYQNFGCCLSRCLLHSIDIRSADVPKADSCGVMNRPWNIQKFCSVLINAPTGDNLSPFLLVNYQKKGGSYPFSMYFFYNNVGKSSTGLAGGYITVMDFPLIMVEVSVFSASVYNVTFVLFFF